MFAGIFFMKKIPLSQGYFAMIDDDDFEKASKFTWCVDKRRTNNYAKCSIGKKRKMYLHHLIIGKPPINMVTDHKDRNGLNNQKNNIWHCTHSQNNKNKPFPLKKRVSKNKTNHQPSICIHFHKKRKFWMINERVNNKTVYLGMAKTLKGAKAKIKQTKGNQTNLFIN